MAKIPKFKSDKELAKFWDTHSLADFADNLVPAKMNQAKIIVKNLTQICLAAPSSWEGRLGSKGFVYIKYRWGVLRVYRTAREEETIEKRSQIFEKRLGGRFDGYMETNEMKMKLAGLFRFQGRTKMHEDWHALQRKHQFLGVKESAKVMERLRRRSASKNG